MSRVRTLGLALAVLGSAMPALAHVGLEPATVTANTTVQVGFRIGHGCGTSPTTSVKVLIPAGVTAVRPQPKAGWTLTVVTAPVQAAAAGATAPAPQVQEVHWTGGNLSNDFYDTFFMRFRAPDAPETTVHFPVVQECPGGGAHRWIEIPKAGQPEPAEPAPGLRLTR